MTLMIDDKGTSSSISFGTDGWRAIIAEDFTFSNLEGVAQAYADHLNINELGLPDTKLPNSVSQTVRSSLQTKPNNLVIVGYDCRFMSELFARRVAEVISGNNLSVALFKKAVPTPLVSWTVRESNAIGGVVITASHNPPEYNGFKIKAAWGGSAPQSVTKSVEALIRRQSIRRKSYKENLFKELLESSEQSYRTQIYKLIDIERIKDKKISVVIDPMYGVGGNWVESFLQGGNICAETIRANKNATFNGVNPEPIDQNLEALKSRVKTNKAIIGLATDGDADRIGAVNELGETMTMHEIVPLLLLHLIRHRKLSGGIVTTFSQSILIKKIAEAHGLPLYETKIGFKYIAELILKKNILIGAEESGGIAIQGHIPERDGILSSLLLLETVIYSDKAPSKMVQDLHREFGQFYYDRRDLRVEINLGKSYIAALYARPFTLIANYKVTNIKKYDGIKLFFGDESWLLFRQSGTEPLMRIYCEATSKAKRNLLLDAASEIVFKSLYQHDDKY